MKNVMTKIKKFATAGASIALLGTSMVSGAAAASFADYPAPFVKDGKYDANAFIVIGENAATMDVIGAVDVAASLQAVSVSETAVSVSASCATSGLSVLGDTAQFKVSNDILAYGENLGSVRSQFIGKIDGSGDILAFTDNGRRSNSVDGNSYNEYLYFEDMNQGVNTLANVSVQYTEARGDKDFPHNDDGKVDSYLVFNKGNSNNINSSIFEYEMDFSSSNNWEIELPSSSYTYQGDSISILGSDYHVIRGSLNSAKDTLTLELLGNLPDLDSGDDTLTVYQADLAAAAYGDYELPNQGVTEPFMVGIYEVVVSLVSSTPDSKATFDVEFTNTVSGESEKARSIKLTQGGSIKSVGNNNELFMYLDTVDSTGTDGTEFAEFIIGTDSVKLVDNFTDDAFTSSGTGVYVDDKGLKNGFLRMKGSYDSDNEEVDLRKIEYRLNNLKDDVYVPPKHGLREYLSDDCDSATWTCDDPDDYQYYNGLLASDWDIRFDGMTGAASSNISLTESSGSLDLGITLQGDSKETDLEIIQFDRNKPAAWRTNDGTFSNRYGGDFEAFLFTEGIYNATAGNITNSTGAPCLGTNYLTCQLIFEDDTFVVSHKATRDDDVRTRILTYTDIDTGSLTVDFSSVGSSGDDTTSYDTVSGNKNVLGEAKLNAGGDEYQFYILNNSTLGYPIVVDMNKDGDVQGDVAILANEFGVVLEFEAQSIPPYLGTGNTNTVNINVTYKDDMFEDRDADYLVKIPITIDNSTNEDASFGTIVDSDGDQITQSDDSVSGDEDVELGADEFGTTYRLEEDSSSSSNDDSDLYLVAPNEQSSAKVFVTFGDFEVSETAMAGEAMSQRVNRARLGMAVLDSEASSYVGSDGSFSKNLVVVGGPCANSVAAALEGKSADSCGEGYEPGQSFLKMVESGDNVAVLAFGYDAAATKESTDKLSSMASADNAGLGTEVSMN